MCGQQELMCVCVCVCGCPGSLGSLCCPHKDTLPTKCSTRTDVCVCLPRQSGQSLLSTRTIYLLSAQQGLMCVCVVAQAVWAVVVDHKDNLPT